MSQFPLLKLPLLSQLEILDRFSTSQLLIFSLASKRAAELVKQVNRHVGVLTWDFIFSEDEGATNRMVLDKDADFHIDETDLTLLIPMDEEAVDGERKEFLLGGQVVPWYCKEGGNSWFVGDNYESNEARYKVMDLLTEHILRVFKVDAYRLVTTDVDDMSNLFLWKYTKEFDNVTLWNTSSQQIEFVLRELTMDTCEVAYEETDDYQYNGPLRMNHLRVLYNWCFHLDAILNSDCDRIYAENLARVPGDSINTIIKHWQNGGLTNLSFFRATSLSVEGVLDDVETFPWNNANRPKRWDVFELSHAVDFRRNDGMLASVDVINRECRFFIWHQKYLDLGRSRVF